MDWKSKPLTLTDNQPDLTTSFNETYRKIRDMINKHESLPIITF